MITCNNTRPSELVYALVFAVVKVRLLSVIASQELVVQLNRRPGTAGDPADRAKAGAEIVIELNCKLFAYGNVNSKVILPMLIV